MLTEDNESVDAKNVSVMKLLRSTLKQPYEDHHMMVSYGFRPFAFYNIHATTPGRHY